jgi:homoserine O-acetyltransferase/O-succinyltransferase
MAHHIFRYGKDLRLESGETLQGYHLAYTTYGALNERKDNAVWIFHALTANSDPAEWWPGLIGEGKLFDPADYFIVCVNMPGSCYGSIGPLDINPITQTPWFHRFPLFTTRDMIHAYQPLRESLGINKIKIGIGGSMGGQQLLEWAVEEPTLFEFIFPIATNAVHSPWGIAFNASQRLAIEMDNTWLTDHPEAGVNGMKVARGFALISYRHYTTYGKGQTETDANLLDGFKSESYQRYQGEKLAKRFNAFSYHFLSKSMDSHNLGRGRGGLASALARVRAATMAIGIETDILFPLVEQQLLADLIPGAVFKAIVSPYGHDGFLLEFDQLNPIISEFVGHRDSTASEIEAGLRLK